MFIQRLLASAAIATVAIYGAPAPAEAQSRGARTAQAAPAPVQRAVSFAAQPGAAEGALVLPLASADQLEARATTLSESEREALRRALAAAEFSYAARQTLSLRGIGDWGRILVVGMAGVEDALGYQTAGAIVGRALLSESSAVTVMAQGWEGPLVAEFATGMGLGEYRSDLHAAARRSAAAPGPTLIVSDAADAHTLYAARGRALVEAMAWARDISNEPGNIVYPEVFVSRARAAFAGVRGVNIQVLDVPAMERLGMGALLAVGSGSSRPPRMMIVSYRGAGAPAGGPIVLVGKGITFDSGGLSIKPAANMANMRMDMSGAASVTGAVLALARSGAPVNVVAIAALAENMPDGAAMRPGDVVTAMNGTTIEVTNTDAEGRLVLVDAIAYAEAHLAPTAIVDVATLTGAVVGALGDDYAGLFSRHDALADQLTQAGEATGELLWRMPMHASYATDMNSSIADISNSGTGPGAGTGAHFISRFVSEDTPWAHLDIAGVSWGPANDVKPAGSAGFSVRLLERFVRDFQPIAPNQDDAD